MHDGADGPQSEGVEAVLRRVLEAMRDRPMARLVETFVSVEPDPSSRLAAMTALAGAVFKRSGSMNGSAPHHPAAYLSVWSKSREHSWYDLRFMVRCATLAPYERP